MTDRTYDVALTAQPEGGFRATVPVLPDVITEGETRVEALSMAKDAIEAYLEAMHAKGWDLPEVEHHTIRIEVNA